MGKKCIEKQGKKKKRRRKEENQINILLLVNVVEDFKVN